MILDTNFLIDLFNKEPNAFDKGIQLAESRTIQRVPAPVVTEVTHGVEMIQGDSEKVQEERRNIHNVLRMYPVVEINEHLARRAGELLADADLESEQRTGGMSGVETVDAMVAAVADSVGSPVLTNNVEDFEKLGADVVTY